MKSNDSSVSIEGGRTLNTQKLKKSILPNLPYLFIFWLMDKMGEAYRLSEAVNFFPRIIDAINGLAKLGENLFPSLHPFDMMVGVVGVLVIWLIVFLKKKDAKKYRKGVEYGSARWGTSEDIKPYIDPDFSKNILLTQTERIMVGRNKQPKYNINKNVLVIGGSGSGKTRFHIKPNLMQMNASFIVTDPKGTVIEECGKMLVEGGYKIKVLNLIDFSQSMKYNPFRYLHSENDILKLVNCIMENTKGEGTSSGEDFWQKAEALYYQALIAYIWYEARSEEKNMNTLLAMLNASEVREEDEMFENAVDKLFRELEQKNPEHFAVRQYKKYKLAAGKTAKSILISCGARLAPFDIAEVRSLMSDDELEIDRLGHEKTALFVVVSDTDTTFHFIAAMMYTQMFNVLCEEALRCGGALPVHVTCLLDEFANQKIPNFQHIISVIRSREISAHIVVQTQSQLKAIYKDHAETIVGNCSCVLFLGGKERSTLKEISEMLGKETIDLYNTSVTKGNQESHGQNFQKLGKDLMSPDEIAVMDNSKCILQVQGIRPFFSDKYDITRHPQYKKLSDYHSKNRFDVKQYLSHHLKVQSEDQYEVFEVEVE